MAHTPGPWTVHNPYPNEVYVAGPTNHSVAYVIHNDDERKEQADDARLIAAAPDLLTVLEAVEWINRNGYRYCPWCQSVKEDGGHSDNCQRQAALAKAKAE